MRCRDESFSASTKKLLVELDGPHRKARCRSRAPLSPAATRLVVNSSSAVLTLRPILGLPDAGSCNGDIHGDFGSGTDRLTAEKYVLAAGIGVSSVSARPAAQRGHARGRAKRGLLII